MKYDHMSDNEGWAIILMALGLLVASCLLMSGCADKTAPSFIDVSISGP